MVERIPATTAGSAGMAAPKGHHQRCLLAQISRPRSIRPFPCDYGDILVGSCGKVGRRCYPLRRSSRRPKLGHSRVNTYEVQRRPDSPTSVYSPVPTGASSISANPSGSSALVPPTSALILPASVVFLSVITVRGAYLGTA